MHKHFYLISLVYYENVFFKFKSNDVILKTSKTDLNLEFLLHVIKMNLMCIVENIKM